MASRAPRLYMSCCRVVGLGWRRLEGEMLFPDVIGLEAMAQVAVALMGTNELPVFEQMKFNRAIVVSASAATRIRVAALARKPDLVEVVIRSEETGFQFDHFST